MVIIIAVLRVILSLAAGVGGIAMIASMKRRGRAYDQGVVQVLDGPLTKIHVRKENGNDEFRYQVGGRTFTFVPREGWWLVQHGGRYRIYSVAGDLLSIEPL